MQGSSDDVLLKILSQPEITIQDLCQVSKVNKKFHTIANNEQLWKSKIEIPFSHHLFPLTHPKDQSRALTDIASDQQVKTCFNEYEAFKKFVNKLKSSLSGALYEYIIKNRCAYKLKIRTKHHLKNKTRLFFHKKDYVSEWINTQELTYGQKRDLSFFDTNKNGLKAAKHYISACKAIDNIYDKESAQQTLAILEELSNQPLPAGGLNIYIKECIKTLNSRMDKFDHFPKFDVKQRLAQHDFIERAEKKLSPLNFKLYFYALDKERLNALNKELHSLEEKQQHLQAKATETLPQILFDDTACDIRRCLIFIRSTEEWCKLAELDEPTIANEYEKRGLANRCENLNEAESKLKLLQIIDKKVYLETVACIYDLYREKEDPLLLANKPC